MIIRKTWFAVGGIMVASLGLSTSATVMAQHGPGRGTLKGTIAEVRSASTRERTTRCFN